MLTPEQRARIDVVLVSPRNPLNIGAVARAMANFGFEHLTVVSAYDPHWREARSAVGAPELLQHARETQAIADALAPCTFVAGTGTLTHRNPEQTVLSLPHLAPRMALELARGGRAALVLGPEKHGLTRDDLSYCHVLVEIPTDPRQPSMNLGQAAAVCLYELAARPPQSTSIPEPANAPQSTTLTADSAQLDRLAALIDQTMAAAEYSPETMRQANHHDLRLLLRRLAPNAHDTRRILGLFRRILWRLSHQPTAEKTSPHR
ncbi:MAG TPA: RNA methyltransferase [Terracidiphilus sp.]